MYSYIIIIIIAFTGAIQGGVGEGEELECSVSLVSGTDVHMYI